MIKTLVVDDELVSRNKMRKILESFGECEAVGSGKTAIAAFREAWENWSPFDLIALDISMPGMDGIDVLLEIKSMEKEKNMSEAKRVKIMMVTSHSDKENLNTCFSAGCDDYVVKPFDREMIIAKLEKFGFETSSTD